MTINMDKLRAAFSNKSAVEFALSLTQIAENKKVSNQELAEAAELILLYLIDQHKVKLKVLKI